MILIATIINILFFAGLGLCFGSFALATAWRIRKKKDFVRDTSECEKCHHKLAAKDLIPLISFAVLKGRCQYCRKKITKLLPVAELTGALFFAGSYAFWPYSLNSPLNIAQFVVWCVSLILILILFFYDLQWFILPNKIIHPLWAVSVLYFMLTFAKTPTLYTLLGAIAAVGIASGLFLLFYIASKGKWIGFGDVRLGLAIGLFTAHPISAGLVLFVASLVGILVALPGLLSGTKRLASKMPFGPLLIIGLVVTMLFGQQFISWYTTSILLL